MIDKFNNMLPAPIVALVNSPFTFYPTGSRFFGGCVMPDADWDFIAEDSVATRLALSGLGFQPNDTETYDDATICSVFTYCSSSFEKGLVKIDVQLANTAMLNNKLLIQKILKDKYGDSGLPGDKCARREIWHLMYYTLKTLAIIQ